MMHGQKNVKLQKTYFNAHKSVRHFKAYHLSLIKVCVRKPLASATEFSLVPRIIGW